MANSLTQHTFCPHCHSTATVKQVASLYENPHYQHDARFAPPAKMAEKSFLLVPIIIGVVIETLTLIAIMIVCASNTFSFGQYLVSVIGICIPLAWSAYAFFRMVRTEDHSQAQYDWDEAMATWSHLDYCTADDLVFNPAATPATETVPVLVPAVSAPKEEPRRKMPVVAHAA